MLAANCGLQFVRHEVAQSTPRCDLCCPVEVLPAQLLSGVCGCCCRLLQRCLLLMRLLLCDSLWLCGEERCVRRVCSKRVSGGLQTLVLRRHIAWHSCTSASQQPTSSCLGPHQCRMEVPAWPRLPQRRRLPQLTVPLRLLRQRSQTMHLLACLGPQGPAAPHVGRR